MKSTILIAIILPLIFACSSVKKVIELPEPPKVKIQKIDITSLSAFNADLEITLSVNNPNRISYDVKNLKYSLDIESKTVTTGTLKEKILVKGKETTMVKVPLRVNYKDILGSAFRLFKNGEIPYLVKGSVQVGPFTIPFNDKGNLKSGDL